MDHLLISEFNPDLLLRDTFSLVFQCQKKDSFHTGGREEYYYSN
jgi:hypothetical protein